MTQARLSQCGAESDVGLSVLTGAERKAHVAVRLTGIGVREHARATGRSPGTVGTLLQRAEQRFEQGGK